MTTCPVFNKDGVTLSCGLEWEDPNYITYGIALMPGGTRVGVIDDTRWTTDNHVNSGTAFLTWPGLQCTGVFWPFLTDFYNSDDIGHIAADSSGAIYYWVTSAGSSSLAEGLNAGLVRQTGPSSGRVIIPGNTDSDYMETHLGPTYNPYDGYLYDIDMSTGAVTRISTSGAQTYLFTAPGGGGDYWYTPTFTADGGMWISKFSTMHRYGLKDGSHRTTSFDEGGTCFPQADSSVLWPSYSAGKLWRINPNMTYQESGCKAMGRGITGHISQQVGGKCAILFPSFGSTGNVSKSWTLGLGGGWTVGEIRNV